MLGGGPRPTYKVVDGTLQRGPDEPMGTRQAIASTLAGALTGLAAGVHEHSALGAFAMGAAATLPAGAKADAQARQQAIQDDQRQRAQDAAGQEALLKQAQTFEANQRTALLSRQAAEADAKSRQGYIDQSAPAIEAARNEQAGGQSALKREHLTEAQLMQEHSQDGARHATSNIYLPDGEQAAVDPKTGLPLKNADGSPRMEYTYAELDPHAQIAVDSSALDEAVKNGYAVPGYTPGGGGQLQMPVHAAAQIANFNQGVEHFQGLTRQINSTLGLKGDEALDPEEIIQKNPQLGQAVGQLASHWDGRPSTLQKALDSMQAPGRDGRPNPAAASAQTIANAIGGDKLDAFDQKVAGEAKAREAAPEDQQKAAIAAGERRANEAFQTGLKNVDKEIATGAASNKDARDKVEANYVKPFGEKLQAANELVESLAQAEQGNVAASKAALFKMVGITQPGGGKRLSPEALRQIETQGNIPQQFIGKVKAALTGDQWTSAMTADMKGFAASQVKVAQDALRTGIRQTNALYGTSIDPEKVINAAPALNVPAAGPQAGKWGTLIPPQKTLQP